MNTGKTGKEWNWREARAYPVYLVYIIGRSFDITNNIYTSIITRKQTSNHLNVLL